MSSYQIAVIVGSIRKDSINRKLADAVVKLFPDEFSFTQVQINYLPLYNQDDDAHLKTPVLEFKAEIQAAQSLIFVTPEYNRSIPGVLKNAIDQGSRPHNQNVWAKKPAGILGGSPGTMGTAMAQQHLRNVLASLDVLVLAQPDAFIQVKEGLFDVENNIAILNRPFFQKWVDKYIVWVKRNISQ